MNRGILVVVSGFSGAGKGTLMKRLMEKYDDYALSVSVTTRSPREGEREGREYFFRTREEFKELIAQEQLIEYARYVDNYYGTPKEYVENQLNGGKDVVLEIEIQGALEVKKKMPDTLLLFVTAPSAQVLKNILEGRGTESPELIRNRLERACEEAEGISGYDYLLVNEKLEECVDLMHGIIQSEHYRISRQQTFAANIVQELKAFVKGE